MKIFTDVKSGWSMERPGLAELLMTVTLRRERQIALLSLAEKTDCGFRLKRAGYSQAKPAP
jgi:hypothetical protein